MPTRRDILRLAAGSAALAATGCAGPAPDGTVKILSHPGQILPIFTHHAAHLGRLGVKLRLLESPDPTSYLDAVKDHQTGGGRYDLVMIFPRFNGDLAACGYLQPLDDLIATHGAAALFDGIEDAYRTLYCRWGGKTIAVPVDGDVAMLYYRKDALENPAHRAKYKAKTGRELRVPRTWEELRDVAEFFTGWAWGPTGKPGYGFQSSTWDRSYCEQQWAPMMASAGGAWLTKDARPAWAGEAGVRALRDLKALLAFTPPGTLAMSWDHTMESIFSNDVALTLWYMDLGRLGGSPKSWFARSGGPDKMRNLGYAPWPGYETAGTYRNFNSMFYGRVVGLSRHARNPEAAFTVLKTLLDPAHRVKSLDDPQSGSDMVLKGDYEPAAFKTLAPDPGFLRTAKAVIANGFPEMQLPGAGEYMDALQGRIHAYLTGSTSDPAVALKDAADLWESITERRGRTRQAEIWAEVSARYRQAGLKIAELG
jgi:multiple sugar transport system substrate-binding protein